MDVIMFVVTFGGSAAVGAGVGWWLGNRHGWRACDLAWWEEQRDAAAVHRAAATSTQPAPSVPRTDGAYRPRHARWNTPTEAFNALVDATWDPDDRTNLLSEGVDAP